MIRKGKKMPQDPETSFADIAATTAVDEPAAPPMPDVPFFPPPSEAPAPAATMAEPEPGERTVEVEALVSRCLRPGTDGHLVSVMRGSRWQQPEGLAIKQAANKLVRLVEPPPIAEEPAA